MALRFDFAGFVPHLRMEQDCPNGTGDQGELLAGVGTAVIHIELHGYSIGDDSCSEYLLEIVGVVIVKQIFRPPAAGSGRDNHDTAEPAAAPILLDAGR